MYTASPSGKLPRQEDVKRYRALLPTSQQPPEPSDDDPKGGGSRRPRPPLTRVACGACRSRKTRCCGSRPVCEQCQTRGSECTYMSKDKTETRFEALKRECHTLRQKTNSLQDIVDRLRNESEDVAQAALRELRADRVAGDRDASMSDLDGSSSHEDQPSDQLPATPTVHATQSIHTLESTVANAEYLTAHHPNPYLQAQQSASVTLVGTNSSGFPAMAYSGSELSNGLTFQLLDPNSLDAYAQPLQYDGEMDGTDVDGVYADGSMRDWYTENPGQRPQHDWNG